MVQRTPLPLATSPFDFEIRPGASLASVARSLRAAGVLPHPLALTALARVKGADRTIKAGSYEIERGITLPGLLAKLTQGDVTQSAVTIVEGTTFADLKRALREDPEIGHGVIDLADAELLARIGAVESNPEGLFFPDTYYLATGSSDLALLKRAYRALHDRLDAAWSRRAPDLPLATPYEALVLASIVEKETGHADDRPLIASVFINRLKRGMRLQTDPSVIYGLGARFDGNLRKRDLEADSAVQHVYARRAAANADRAPLASVDRRRAQSTGNALSLFRVARRRYIGILREPVRPQSRRVKIPEGRALDARHRVRLRNRGPAPHRPLRPAIR